MNSERRNIRCRWIATLLIAAVALLSVLCIRSSLYWLGTTFPGFFVLDNRVVASVSLPHWSVADHVHLYQHQVMAVNGHPVSSADEVYTLVRQHAPPTLLQYTLEKHGQRIEVTLPVQTFTLHDYALLFGAALFTGLTIALLGVVVWLLKPEDRAARALCLASLALGTFCLTVLDLYGPAQFFRLHAMCEAIFPWCFVYFGLLFPVDRLRRFAPLLAPLFAVSAGVLVVTYQIVLFLPEAYSLIHNFCMLSVGLGGVPLVVGWGLAYVTTTSYLVRQRLRVILLGLLGGFAFPIALMGYSGITGGEVAVNYTAFTAFVFPLSIGYAVVKHDLFEIDALLKRSMYYVALTVTLSLSYIAFLALLNLTLRSSDLVRSPVLPLLFTLGVVLFLNPLKDFLQRAIDRVFFRVHYNPQKVLERTSASLAATLHLDEILATVWKTVNESLAITKGGIFLLKPETNCYVLEYPEGPAPVALTSGHPLVRVLAQHGRILSSYDLGEGVPFVAQASECVAALERLTAQLLVPLMFKGDLLGFFALGGKESGEFFSSDDHDFLSTFANQSALSIANARSYTAIEELNTGLEQKVEERTRALAKANTELQTSLQQLEQTYRNLQRSQDSLLRAEKMAALGRLTAGIAHEMNTPLGASLSSLKIVKDLVSEYRASITDANVTREDHQHIAAEMDTLVQKTQQWLEKAAAHIRSLKLHTRDLKPGEEKPFSVLQAIEDTGLLLAHRFRQAQCTLVVSCPATNPFVYGDPGKLGQVLTNLMANAIDSYKDGNAATRTIEVAVADDGNFLLIRVSDHGCGIAPTHIERIFDDFFSTKPLGEGTGLGLSISRDIITNFFAGTIAVESALERGSVFTLRLPRSRTVDILSR